MSNLQQTLVRQSRNPFRTHELTNILFPSLDGGWRDIFRSGWLPGWFNQQWGGAQAGHEIMDAATGQVYKFEPATGNIQDDSGAGQFSGAASNYYTAQGFKVSESFTLDAIWVKLYKVQGAVATNYTITARIYSDNAGAPNAAIGSAATISTRVITTKTDGDWYRLSGLNCALTAGTQYHIVLSTLSAVDATTYPSVKLTLSKKYPFGNLNNGTSVPAWTPQATYSMCFLVEPPASSKFIQGSGLFDQKLVFQTGSPVSQSKILSQPARNFFDGKNGTILFRGNAPISSTVADFAYGLDHDRITLTTNASGYPVVTLYRQDRTAYTVVGTSSIASGNQDIAVVYRCAGDGADYLKLYVNGASQGTPLTSQTFIMDPLFRDLATAWVGGGFPLATAWTQDMQMTALPSTQGWTWTGTATEANAMSVTNGKLYQNKGGYASADNGYYSKTTSFVNATGWTISVKGRVSSGTNDSYANFSFSVNDGTKFIQIFIQEYFIQSYSSSVDFTVQGDFKSQEHVFTLCGKGSDYYLFIDGKLAIDGTGKLTTSSATNTVNFGDISTNAGTNADGIWSYLKYYQGGMLLPSSASGATLNEFAYWSGNKSNLLVDLYNAGSPLAVKQYCGMERNYVENIQQPEFRKPVSSTSTSATTPGLALDSELFVIGSDLDINLQISCMLSAAGNTVWISPRVDGTIFYPVTSQSTGYTANAGVSNTVRTRVVGSLGIHKIEGVWWVNSGTATTTITNVTSSHSRNLAVISKS